MCGWSGRRFGEGKAILLKPAANALLWRLNFSLSKVSFFNSSLCNTKELKRHIFPTEPEWVGGDQDIAKTGSSVCVYGR